MSFFHNKKQYEPLQENPQTVKAENKSTQQSTPLLNEQTAEESARQWWHEHYGEQMPEEIVSWMKQLTRTEARRQYLADALLSPQKQQRIEDSKRLAETKLRNIESALQRLHDQQEWLRRFSECKHELEEHKARLLDANKRLTTIAHEERDLERFETFETVQGLFQRMQMLERLTRENKQIQGTTANEAETLRQHTDEMQKQLQQVSDDYQDAKRQMDLVREHIDQVNRILGERATLDIDEKSLNDLRTKLSQQHDTLSQEISYHESEQSRLQETITQKNIRLQAMEPHNQMIQNGEIILTLLERLQELHNKMEEITRQQNDQQLQQQQENDMLSRVFAEYQKVEQNIKALNFELELHRNQNLGLSSYSLQERAMQMRSRHETLIGAQSLWNRIQTGYRLIEEKTQAVNQLRLKLDKLNHDIAELEKVVIPMRQLCHEKEYTLTLSKSQNVIQLRGDLKEGVSCTVCGATTHPYHSDTILEQNKLISELRTEFELLNAELVAKEQLLKELMMTKVATTERREVEEETLSLLRHRQMEDVKEWGIYSSLDPSFKECSSSTNMGARATLITQLIENAKKEAEKAHSELDEFNFHQNRINETVEALNKAEQQRADLTTNLNEVNTGCQVLARMVEHTRQRRVQIQTLYTQLYERLNGIISLKGWFETWKNNPDTIRLQLQQMMDEWEQLKEESDLAQQELKMQQTLVEMKRTSDRFNENLSLIIRDEQEKRNTMRKEGEKVYATLTGKCDVKEYYEANLQQLLQAKERWHQQAEATRQTTRQLSELEGRLQQLVSDGNRMAAQAVDERSQLDIWMRQFNANHPPVQYAELEEAFSQDKDWNITREKVRSLRIETMLEQARVDALRSSIVSLQAEGIRPSDNDNAEILQSLLAQKVQLENQRQEVMLQLAEQDIAQNRHNECRELLKAEEEKLYAMTDKTTS